jgi:hypothetical protein
MSSNKQELSGKSVIEECQWQVESSRAQQIQYRTDIEDKVTSQTLASSEKQPDNGFRGICPAPAFLLQHSFPAPRCPAPAVLFQLSCSSTLVPSSPVPTVLSFLSCPSSLFLSILSSLICLADLSRLTFPNCPVQISHRSSSPRCPVPCVLAWRSCHGT